MARHDTDAAFLNDATAELRGTGGGAGRLLFFVVVGLAAFVGWAATHEIEEVTRAQGRVVPSQQLQIVQSADGGVVTEIAVREGQTVTPDMPLMRIDDTRAGADLGELREREAGLMIAQARALAEAEGADTLSFDPALHDRAPEAVAATRAVFRTRRQQLAAELAVLGDQLDQRRAALLENAAARDRLAAETAILREEVILTRDLAGRGSVPRVELLRLERQLAAQTGEQSVLEARVPGLEAAIREAENQIRSARSSYVLTARQRAEELGNELSILREAIRGATDTVSRTTLRAPVAGTVNRINVATIGAVVQPGAPLVEIVPQDDTMLIDAFVQPADVAFIRPGQEASVKITAYDYLVYGALTGRLERIGADAISDPDGNPVFQVQIRTDAVALTAADGTALPISPGMVAQVDILTGRKTVLNYLLRPLRRAQAEALRER